MPARGPARPAGKRVPAGEGVAAAAGESGSGAWGAGGWAGEDGRAELLVLSPLAAEYEQTSVLAGSLSFPRPKGGQGQGADSLGSSARDAGLRPTGRGIPLRLVQYRRGRGGGRVTHGQVVELGPDLGGTGPDRHSACSRRERCLS